MKKTQMKERYVSKYVGIFITPGRKRRPLVLLVQIGVYFTLMFVFYMLRIKHCNTDKFN